MKKVIVLILLSLIIFPLPAKAETKKIEYWVAPMDANYRRDEAGKSPMGMDLIPVYEESSEDNGLFLSPSVINNLGVRTAKVKKEGFSKTIETVGYIGYDETKIGHIHTRAKGWIEKIYVYSVGQKVERGDLLFEFYSPDIVNAQSEYLQALRIGNKSIINRSKDRLRGFGIMEMQIKNIKKTRKINRLIKVFAHHDGVITMIKASHGKFITPKDMIIETADLSTVWVLVDIFEKYAKDIKAGLNAEVSFSFDKGEKLNGKITYVYPEVNIKTRTIKARLEFDNIEDILKINMYANIKIMGVEKPNTLTIPREALIRTGNSERVILALGNGRFQPAEVISGAESGEVVEILSGIKVEEKVVVSAQFLIDSEASFKGTAIRMSEMKGQEND